MITERKIIGAQGEVVIIACVGNIPASAIPLNDNDRLGRPIIGHSESGHHHVLERATTVVEEPNPPAGMRILYALLDQPTMLVQDATDAHGAHSLAPGLYEFRVAREYDPFLEQARLVVD